MKRKIIMLYISHAKSLLIMVGLCSLASCSKNIDPTLPGNGQEAYINFYNASEAALQGATQNLGLDPEHDNMVYINDSVPAATFPSYPRFRQVGGLAYLGDIRQFPESASGTVVIDNPNGKGEIFWMPIRSGSHRFIYTSYNKVFLKDTTVQLAPKEIWNQYLVESPEAPDRYIIVSNKVKPQGMSGKVGIELVHLSPDVPGVSLQQLNADGQPVGDGLPQQLAFGHSTNLVWLDLQYADKNGLLFLQISRGSGSEPLLVRSVPAISGASFNLVLQGFAAENQRKLKTGEETYTVVNIKPNLRINSRRIY